MKIHMKSRTISLLVLGTLSILLLTTCSTAAATSAASTPMVVFEQPVSSANQPDSENHTPVILKVVERTERAGNQTKVIEEITFVDAAGDATTIVDTPVSSVQNASVSDVDFLVPAEEQKSGATVTDSWTCNTNPAFKVENRILDRAGNLSEPVLVTIECPVSYPNLLPYLIGGLILGASLLVGAWQLLRNRPSERKTTFQSVLLFFCMCFPLNFAFYIIHEGGHALTTLLHGKTVAVFFVHPFSFGGYNLPPFDWNSALYHAGGVLAALPISLLISIPFWKRRSISNLPMIMFFPWVALLQGQRMLLVGGDFASITHLTGLPFLLFVVAGLLIVGAGICLLLSLLPLFGLIPGSKKSFFVLPTALLLWSVVGLAVSYLFVPGSPIDVQYYLKKEIFNASILFTVVSPVIGILLAALYRTVYPKFPAWLHTGTVSLTWKDLRLPTLLAAVSVILGILIIT